MEHRILKIDDLIDPNFDLDQNLFMSVDEIDALLGTNTHLDEEYLNHTMIEEERIMMEHLNQVEANRRLAQDNNQLFMNQHGGAHKLYNLTGRYETDNIKYNCKQIEYVFTSNDSRINDFLTANQMCHQFISEICRDYIISIPDINVKVGIIIDHEAFHSPISLPLRNKNDYNSDILWQRIEQVVQSKKPENFKPHQKFTVTVIIAKIPQGSGKTINEVLKWSEQVEKSLLMKSNLNKSEKRHHQKKMRMKLNNQVSNPLIFKEVSNTDEWIKCKKSIIDASAYSNDNLCLLRAVIVAKAFCEKEKKVCNLYQQYSSEMRSRVVSLKNALNLPNKSLGIDAVKKIEAYYQDYQIMVIPPTYRITREPIYLNQDKKFKKFISLLLYNEHYYVVKSMSAFVGTSYYCSFCKVGYDSRFLHTCEHICQACKRLHCKRETNITCDQCQRVCLSEKCKQIHSESICDKLKPCNECGYIKSSYNHVCGENMKWCHYCKKAVPQDHLCYLMTEDERLVQSKNKKDKEFKGYVFFDFEATEDPSTLSHEVNLAIAQKICLNCLEIVKPSDRCESCQKFYTFKSINEFCEWSLKQHNTIQIAHNLKGYDGKFIINYMLNNTIPSDSLPRAIANGTKLLSIEFRNIKFIDSLSFLPMPLASFTKAFSLEDDEYTKGYFPHRFNKPENYNYNGPYPSKDYYQPELFSIEKKAIFDKWYDEQVANGANFNFQKEFYAYCLSDVKILAEGCLTFRRVNIEATKRNTNDKGVDPFRTSLTIASFANHCFRRDHMLSKSIAVIPETSLKDKTSIKCQKWLKFLSEKYKIKIKHAKNGGEVYCGTYKLDGVCEETKTIYEFNGCYWHGCLKCYTITTFNTLRQLQQHTVYNRHQDRIRFIKNQMKDYKIVEMWEHDWDRISRDDPELQKFLKGEDNIDPLIMPRDALFGGRTNALKLYHKCEEGEKIYYYDFTSLYPWAQKYCRYPVGHPEIFTENIDHNKKYFGLMKCKILPPKYLYIPVLPARINKKLIFPCCRLCAEELSHEKCQHNDEERALTGTWCTPEIDKAIEKGYQILKVYTVWHWNETAIYDKTTKTGGIFTSYINKMLKDKQEASGFPKNCVTDELKLEYIENYFVKEGILLDMNKIIFNSSKRLLAKLMANSEWGYLAMKTNKVQLKFINRIDQWNDMLTNEQYNIHNVVFDHKNHEMMQVYYSISEESHIGGSNTNVALASFVTCHARLHLYEELEKIGERVLYFDTDSIIFRAKNTDYIPPLGDYLGEFTNEIDPKEGDYINEFVSAGPKNYAYKLNTGVSHCTVKGFTLNFATNKDITFDSIKNIVCDDQNKKIEVEQLKFITKKQDWKIKTEMIKKQYGFVYDKRILNTDLTTLPYGFN